MTTAYDLTKLRVVTHSLPVQMCGSAKWLGLVGRPLAYWVRIAQVRPVGTFYDVS
jgi:hypothetical protein